MNEFLEDGDLLDDELFLEEELLEVEGFGLSPQQRRLWLLQPEDSPITAHLEIGLVGRLDEGRLERAVEALAQRHEILHTLFEQPPELKLAIQVVADSAMVAWKQIDLSALPEAEQDLCLHELLHASMAASDLEAGPNLRATLCRRTALLHHLVLSLPVLCSDERSLLNLGKELPRVYEEGIGTSDGALQIDYTQFATWQNQMLEVSNERQEGQAHWQSQPVFSRSRQTLPFFRSTPASKITRKGQESLRGTVPVTLTRRARMIVEGRGASMDLLVLAVFTSLIRRLTGASTISIPFLLEGRKLAELRSALGLFARWVPIQSRLEDGMSLNELLAELAGSLADAEAWQDYYDLDPESSGGDDLLKIGFGVAYCEAPIPISCSELDFEVLRWRARQEPFALELRIVDTFEGLDLEFFYDPDSLAPSLVHRLVGWWCTLIEKVVEEPDAAIDSLSLLSASERREALVERNATLSEEASAKTLPQLFAEQLGSEPQQPAIEIDDATLSYAELGRQAGILARSLRQLGVGPEIPVVISMDRSLELFVAFLGVLEAGGYYIPLDTQIPFERRNWMLEDSGARVILADPQLELDRNGIEVIHPRLESSAGTAQGAAPSSHPVRSENLAYMIYTSGSTGRPKGVGVTHGALANYLMPTVVAYGMGPGDRVLQFSSISFDASAEEIFTPLLCGATSVVWNEAMVSTSHFFERCGALGITVLILPTAYWHLLVADLERLDLRWPTSVRLTVIGGEKASPEAIATWRLRLGTEARLINAYGPTEGTIGATRWALPTDWSEDGVSSVPIGQPIPNYQTYVVDRKLEPVPLAVPGELVLGGAGLARGYLGKAALTAELFVPDPFAQQPGGRLYRTGDRVYWLEERQLAFLDRVDHQVKIRGYRIEVGEIEAVLLEQPDVRQAVVVIDGPDLGEKRLVAYIAGLEGESAIEDLRSSLRRQLPEFMVPPIFVLLEALPFNTSGKIDRKALPDPDHQRRSLIPFVVPETEMERRIAAIWQEVLQVETVGLYDNFFDLGGHSLFMVQIFGQLQASFDTDLTMAELFDAPTVSSMAKRLTGGSTETADMSSARDRARDRRNKLHRRARRRELLQLTEAPEAVDDE